MVTMIRNVSQRVDESSEVRRKELERLKLKARRKENSKSSVLKEGKVLERLSRREKTIAMKALDAVKGKEKVGDADAMETATDDALRMPPPKFLPTRISKQNEDISTRVLSLGNPSLASSSVSSTSSSLSSKSAGVCKRTLSDQYSDYNTAKYDPSPDIDVVGELSEGIGLQSLQDVKPLHEKYPPSSQDSGPSVVPPPSQGRDQNKSKPVLGMRRVAIPPTSSQQRSSDPLRGRTKFRVPFVAQHQSTMFSSTMVPSVTSAEPTFPMKTESDDSINVLPTTPSSLLLQNGTSESVKTLVKSVDVGEDSFGAEFDDMDMDFLSEVDKVCSAYD